MGDLQKGVDLGGQFSAGKFQRQVADDAGGITRAIAQGEDGGGAVIEFHHALGEEQYVRLLRRFPLEAEALGEGDPAVGHRHGQVCSGS